MTTTPVRVVVTDANVLINLMHVSRLGLLGRIPNHEFVVPEHVREEIKRPEQRSVIDAAANDGWLKVVVMWQTRNAHDHRGNHRHYNCALA